MIRTFDYFLKLNLPFYSNVPTITLSKSDNEIAMGVVKIIKQNTSLTYEIDETLSSDIHFQISELLNKEGTYCHAHRLRHLQFSAECGNLSAIVTMLECHKQTFGETYDYKKLLSIDSGDANNLVGCIMLQRKQFQHAVQYFLRAFEQNNESAMLNLGYYYQTQQINHTLMKKYYNMVKNNSHVNFLLGMYHSYAEIDYEKVVQYFSNTPDRLNTLFELGHFYSAFAEHNKTLLLHGADSYGDKNLSIKYYKQWINHKDITETIFNRGLQEMKTMLGNDYEYYQILKSVSKPQKFIANKITEMEKNVDFMKLIYKITISTKYNIVEPCAICFETRLNVFVNCGHLLCISCYKKVDKCPTCREIKNEVRIHICRSRSASPPRRSRRPSPRRESDEEDE